MPKQNQGKNRNRGQEGKRGGRPHSKGHYYAPHPLDFGILERLPVEGSMLGYHTIAMPVKPLTDELNKDVPREAWVQGTQVTGRLVSMKRAGYVTQVVMIGQSERWGWQRTRSGSLHYEEHTGKHLPSPPNGNLRVVGESSIAGDAGDAATGGQV